MQVAVILPAAGAGRRFSAAGSASASKIEYELRGRPVFLRAIDAFHGRPEVSQIILAVAPESLDAFAFRWSEQLGFLHVTLVPGGRVERWETVAAALRHVDADATHIAVHDAARPCPEKAMIDRVFEAAQTCDAVVPGVPVADTLKRVGDAEAPPADDPLDAILGTGSNPAAAYRPIVATVDRRDLFAVQTPQVFAADVLRAAYADLPDDRADITDDAALVERLGTRIVIVPGDRANLKLTAPEDVELLTALIDARERATRENAARAFLLDDDDE